MHLPALEPDHLSVIVVGPGMGEMVLVRAPPGVWLVVDGCGASRVDYGQRILDHYGVRPRLIVLTHPHDDHSRGLHEVIDRATPRSDRSVWPRIGMVLPPGAAAAGKLSIAATLQAGGITEQVIAAVESAWSDEPACRWDVHRGDVEPLGEATVHVISPEPALRTEALDRWKSRKKFDKNIISTALLLAWRGQRIVLGSDLVESPGGGWSHVLAVEPSIGDHELFKVAHHGATKGLHDDLLRPGTRVPNPLRIIAPFASKGLPKAEPGQGLARIGGHGGTTYLTGLPRPHDGQSGGNEALSLTDLAAHATRRFTPSTSGFPDCYVAVSFSPTGGFPQVVQGPGSIRVT